MANAVARRIAIRNAVAARKDGGSEVAKAPAGKAKGTYRAVRLGTFEGDAGKAPFSVTRAELATALGLEGSDGANLAGLGLRAIMAAVSQPRVVAVDGVETRVDERVAGAEGVAALHAGFGAGSLRTLWVDAEAMEAILSDDPAAYEAFVPLFDASERRLEARDARFARLVAGSKARAAAKAAAPEALAA